MATSYFAGMRTAPLLLAPVLSAALCAASCSSAGHGASEEDHMAWPDAWRSLDSTVAAAVEQDLIPGAVLLIERPGTARLHKSYGLADPMRGRAMDKDALFRICSQTKAITATAAMILWERGQLDLDAPVARYLPSFEHIGVLDSLAMDTTFTTRPALRPPTVRHLMAHTAGIPYGEIGDDRFERIYAQRDIVDLFPRDARSSRDNADRLGATCLAHDPGAMWTYGLGLDILVAVIETASGESYADFLQREILDPLGMRDTHFVLPGSKVERLVAVAEHEPEGQGWRDHRHPVYSTDYPLHPEWPLCSGGAGLTSSAEDYTRFLRMYLDRGAIPQGRILQEATVDTVMADHARGLLNGWHQGLAFGVQSRDSGPGPFFWGGYFNTTYFADPLTGTTVVLMKQTYGVKDDPTGAAVNALMGS